MATTGKSAFRDHVMRLVAIIGLIAILLLGAWGIIQLALYIPSLFTRSGSSAPAAESLSVSVNSPVSSGGALTVSWRGLNASGARGYTLSYSCADGLSIKAPTQSGASQTVPCDTPFNFTGDTERMTITPTVSGTKQASVTITVSAIDLAANKIAVTGSASATIKPKAAPAAKPAARTAAPGRSLYGYADLSVRVLSATPLGGRTSVIFEVQNTGTNIAPAGWSFNALLPTAAGGAYAQPYTYQSGSQQALYPGDKIVFTLGFDSGASQICTMQYPSACGYSVYNPYNGRTCYTYDGRANYPAPCTGGGAYPYPWGYQGNSYSATYPWSTSYANRSMTIVVDPYNQVFESNEANNTTTISVW